VAPTVITNGSLPGANGTPLSAPSCAKLPEAATTTTPFSHSFSTAWSIGSKNRLVGSVVCSEKFATLMLYWALAS